MKTKLNTTPVTTNDTTIQLDQFEKKLQEWQKEWKESPEFKRTEKRQNNMRRFLKGSPLYTITETGPCHTCLVHSTCNKSFFDGSACKAYRRALKKFLKDKGWYKNGGREKTN
jgi:hypothetical protein